MIDWLKHINITRLRDTIVFGLVKCLHFMLIIIVCLVLAKIFHLDNSVVVVGPVATALGWEEFSRKNASEENDNKFPLSIKLILIVILISALAMIGVGVSMLFSKS